MLFFLIFSGSAYAETVYDKVAAWYCHELTGKIDPIRTISNFPLEKLSPYHTTTKESGNVIEIYSGHGASFDITFSIEYEPEHSKIISGGLGLEEKVNSTTSYFVKNNREEWLKKFGQPAKNLLGMMEVGAGVDSTGMHTFSFNYDDTVPNVISANWFDSNFQAHAKNLCPEFLK